MPIISLQVVEPNCCLNDLSPYAEPLRAPNQNYFEKSLLQIPERRRSTPGTKVGQVRGFRLRARLESYSRVATWYYSGEALRSITSYEIDTV